MATKKSSAKKASKKSTKKASKKASKKAAIAFPPPPNIQCLLTCYQRYLNCLKKGVPQATCQKRLQRCIIRCLTPGVVDPGPDEE